ncbi:hypothetical protein TNIN_353261 [Trichonephila inaurata madagascariensis]|uniref:Uncharacterized protein n=1 Tax=Trichonephila inaurata madagascariensis TaxID=2747483 RepID=A0A8X7BVW5_9ARAC|nr:hypothetical protein TNIN_353261 [Trichonephila inaurata madagascariensis]
MVMRLTSTRRRNRQRYTAGNPAKISAKNPKTTAAEKKQFSPLEDLRARIGKRSKKQLRYFLRSKLLIREAIWGTTFFLLYVMG